MPVWQESRFGDLFVEYTVVLPTEISAELRQSTCLFLICYKYRHQSLIVLSELTEAFHPHGRGKDEL